MSGKIVMPMGTAAWLLNRTNLTEYQVAEFCQLNLRTVKDIKSQFIKVCEIDPINYTHQLNLEEIKRCEADSSCSLAITKPIFKNLPNEIDTIISNSKKTKEKPYSYHLLRKNKDQYIAFFLKNYPLINNKDIQSMIPSTIKRISYLRENLSAFLEDNQVMSPIASNMLVSGSWEKIKEKYKIK